MVTAIVLLSGLAATASAVVWLQADLASKARIRFDRQADRIEADIQHHLGLPFFGLKGAAGVYAASESVERSEFRAFVELSEVALEYPGVLGFAFVERVKRADITPFTAAQRRDGSPGFTVRSSGNAPELFVIKFMEPLAGNAAALGLDIGNDPVIRLAIDRAVASGRATLSGRVSLVQDAAQRPAFVYLQPVYQAGGNALTETGRWESLSGLLMAPVVVDEVMWGIAASAQGLLDVELFDGRGTAREHLLFDLDGHHAAAQTLADPAAGRGRMFYATREAVVGGRPLTLRLSSLPAFESGAASAGPLICAIAGSVLSLLMALSAWLLGGGRARALALAREMTLNLARERQRLLNIVEGTSVGTWVWQVQTGELQVDQRWAAMIGHDLDALEPMTIARWRERIHPDDRPRAENALQRHFAGAGEHFECESRIRHKDGQWVWVLDRGKVSAWTADGRPQLMSGIHMDISDKQAAQLALRASEEHFRHLFESSLDGILQALPDGSVLYANPAACRLFGMTQHEIRRRGRAGLVDPADSRFHIFMGQSLMTGEARGELTMVRADGSRFECELSSSRYLSQNGESCTNIFLRDVTKRKLAEAQIRALNAELEDRVKRRTAQLEAANQELEAFSYSVAHDLRAPLNSIDGFSHLLQKAVGSDSAGRSGHYLHRIRAGVRQMGELTDGLLALAQVSRASLRHEAVDLAAIAAQVLEGCREREPERQVQVDIEPELKARGDPALLRQVMENLLANAWKFTAHVPEACIRVGKLHGREAHDPVVFYVRDNGAGFDMAYADKLFGTFTRLHSPGEFAGTGIGLATSHRIISRHDGRIWAEGAVAAGATFFFTLGDTPQSPVA